MGAPDFRDRFLAAGAPVRKFRGGKPARRNAPRVLAERERPDEISFPPERGPFRLPRFCLPASHLIP